MQWNLFVVKACDFSAKNAGIQFILSGIFRKFGIKMSFLQSNLSFRKIEFMRILTIHAMLCSSVLTF